MSAPVTILYFARLREAVGTPEEQLSLPDGIATVGALVAHLADADEDKRFAAQLAAAGLAHPRSVAPRRPPPPPQWQLCP